MFDFIMQEKKCIIYIRIEEDIKDDCKYHFNLNYRKLRTLKYMLEYNTEMEDDFTNKDYENKNFELKKIIDLIKNNDVKVFFKFSSFDCDGGTIFCDENDEDVTLLVFVFINLVTEKGCDIIVNDLSMCALFTNWNKYEMEHESPIIIKNENKTIIKLIGKNIYDDSSFSSKNFRLSVSSIELPKKDDVSLTHLYEQSANKDEIVNLELENIFETKMYEINQNVNKEVKIISKGYSKEDNEEYLVHSQFKYKNGNILISSIYD
jgi:hypothetical protein